MLAPRQHKSSPGSGIAGMAWSWQLPQHLSSKLTICHMPRCTLEWDARSGLTSNQSKKLWHWANHTLKQVVHIFWKTMSKAASTAGKKLQTWLTKSILCFTSPSLRPCFKRICARTLPSLSASPSRSRRSRSHFWDSGASGTTNLHKFAMICIDLLLFASPLSHKP